MRDHWLVSNGYTTTRAEYAVNKAGHSLVIGLALALVVPMPLAVVAAWLGYWALGYTRLGDSHHGAPTWRHGFAKLVEGGLAPALVVGRSHPLILAAWLACAALVTWRRW